MYSILVQMYINLVAYNIYIYIYINRVAQPIHEMNCLKMKGKLLFHTYSKKGDMEEFEDCIC